MLGIATLTKSDLAARLTERGRMTTWRLRNRLNRWRRAIAYGLDRMSVEDASQIAYDCEYPAGRYPLATIRVADVLMLARDCWHDDPELPRLVDDAVTRVATKWPGYPDAVQSAEEWAFDLIRESAAAEGINLIEIDD